MKLISIDYLLSRSGTAFLRFPASIISSLVGVCVGIHLVESADDLPNVLLYINLMLCAALGIPLFFSVAIMTERSGSVIHKVLGMVGALGLLALIYLSLPDIDDTHNRTIPYIRYGLFNAIVHLVASFIPYLKTGQLNGFWNFNKSLFIRFCTAVLYSGVLYFGLLMALLALDTLFNVDIDEKRYFEMWIVIAGFFNTWFFVAGIPSDLDQLDEDTNYPKGLKIFTQYILLPLLMLYLVILYSYGAKIVLSWDWPKGIVSYMIAAVSVLGMFTMLLIHPYGKAKGNEWIKRFTNIYYIALFPLIGLLFFAIWLRLDDYGITVNRYAILLLGIWLTLIAGYFALLRGQNIKFIPISLAAMLGISSFGPWGMFSLSERSQVKRLERTLTEAGILKDGKIVNETMWVIADGRANSDNDKQNEGLLSDSTHEEVQSILDYLDDHHGFKSIRPWFAQDVDSLLTVLDKEGGSDDEAWLYEKTLGIGVKKEQHHRYFNYSVKKDKAFRIEDFGHMTTFETGINRSSEMDRSFTINGIKYDQPLKDGKLILVSSTDTLDLKLAAFGKKLCKEHKDLGMQAELEPNVMTITGKLGTTRVTALFEHISMEEENERLSVNNANGYFFFQPITE